MPFYRPIKDIKPKKTRLRMIAGLKALRMQMDEEMPHKTKDSTLILGTWNIRNFDDNRFMSDHLPLWVELEIDFSDKYLDYLETL